MPKLDKSTVALTFKFDCDRFLRYRLATETEVDTKVVPNAVALRNASRPGINLITAQGRAWEARCYDDIVTASKGRAKFQKGTFDKEIDRDKYGTVNDLPKILREKTPPTFVIEAEFDIPGSVGEGLKDALDSKRLNAAVGRPDLIWIRPFEEGVPLVESAQNNPEFIIHVVDVKLAAEPSLRHFVEVTFYALGLQAWLKEKKLSERYGVCAAGLVWPGTHEASAFKNLVAEFAAQGSTDALADALKKTTFAVPYEVYKPRLKQFIDSRLPAVLQTVPNAATWHVSKKCQLCEFFAYCQAEALKLDAISQLPGLTAGQASVLQKSGITTLKQLHTSITGNTVPWVAARTENHTLRAQEGAIKARCEALASGQLVPISGRRTTAMPKFVHLSILLTAHFDPGTGITFAFGANKVHFKGDGTPPNVEEVYLPVDSIHSPGSIMSPVSEGARLAELCQKVKGWLEGLDATNKLAPSDDQQTAHFYVWDSMEARQLARVVARHAGNEEIMAQAAFLLRVFPPEGELANPADWKSQPLTIVKPIVRDLFALPVPFEYTLMDARNWLDPFIGKEGNHIKIQQVWGFATDMSDQIPLERAYEIWQDKPMLRKWHATKPYEEWPRYSKEEIRDGIKTALKTHLKALRDVVSAIAKKYGKQLLLQKEPFSLLKPPVKMQLPSDSIYVLTMEKLSSVAAELENRETLALPVEEREAQFISIRGVVPAAKSQVVKALEEEVKADPRYAQRVAAGDDVVMVFECSRDSRDSRLREGAFTVVLRDEDSEYSLETKWYKAAGHQNYLAAAAQGLSRNGSYKQYQPLKTLLGVNIARIDSMANPPLVALVIEKENLEFAKKSGIRPMTKQMVLDPVHRDFSTELIERAVRKLGGKEK